MAHNYRQLAYRDSITKGPNRNAFDDRLELIDDSPKEAPVVVAMLDLDGFKRSTTVSVTPRGTPSRRRSPGRSKGAYAAMISSPGSAATSSPCSSPGPS